MGLLDTMDDPQFRLGMGLLAAGSARSDGAGFGQRLNEVLGGMDSWKKQKAEEKKAALQEQIYNAQLQEMMQKTARERQLLEQERAKREGFGQVFKSGLPPLMGDPTTGIMPSAGTAPSIDVARGVQLGYTLPEIEALAKVKNINLEKVARTQEVEGPNGEKLIQQLDDFGRPVGKAMPGYTPAQLVSLGDRSVFAKPQAGASFTMGQSPDSKASNALGWANNNLASQRLAFDKAGGADAGKPKLVDGQWVMAPTGMTPGQTLPAVTPVGKKDAIEALALIQSAREVIPKSTGSYLGAGVDQFARVFGQSTSGDDAAAQLKAMEGALVSKMPKMSGPQSDKDVALYKQMAGEIGDPTIPNDRKLAALKSIEEIQNRYAGITQPTKPTNAPIRGQVIDGYKFKGGDPANPSSWEKQ